MIKAMTKIMVSAVLAIMLCSGDVLAHAGTSDARGCHKIEETDIAEHCHGAPTRRSNVEDEQEGFLFVAFFTLLGLILGETPGEDTP